MIKSRANWTSGPPRLHESDRLPPDTPLSDLGETQAEELASHVMSLSLEVDLVYSSPFYRCVQTVQPLVEKFKKQRLRDLEIHGEPGLGEWYGMYRSEDPVPASAKVLKSFFPTYSLEYKPIWVPNSTGESIRELHDRAAYSLAGIIQTLDRIPNAPKSILICTHAATFMALARALTGDFPDDITEQDFYPWTAGLSTFKRREPVEITANLACQPGEKLPELDYTDGKGLGGGWDCIVNGDCSFLSGGQYRGWRFSGKESFSHTLTTHGLDAGTGLGIISEGQNSNKDEGKVV